MGALFQKKETYCRTCGGRRLARTVDRQACLAAGHTIEVVDGRVWWIKYRRAGKSYAESSRSSKKGTAKSLLRRREGDIEGGKPVTPQVGKFTFEAAAQDDQRLHDERSPLARSHRSPHPQTPAAVLGGRRMADISPSLIGAYKVHRLTVPSVLVRKAYTVTDPDGTARRVPRNAARPRMQKSIEN